MSCFAPNETDPARGHTTGRAWCNGAYARTRAAAWHFAQPDLFDRIEEASHAALDDAPFGVIGMARNGRVEIYNATESKLAGLSPSRVIGRHLFTAVAPCTNNYMIGHRFETEETLDATVDYVFTLRMSPTPVRLRLLKRPDARLMYMVVERR
jgi:photoactive yellow protein